MDVKDIRAKLKAVGESAEKLSDEELIKILKQCQNNKNTNRAMKKLKRMLAATFIKWIGWCIAKNIDNGEFSETIDEVNKSTKDFIEKSSIQK